MSNRVAVINGRYVNMGKKGKGKGGKKGTTKGGKDRGDSALASGDTGISGLQGGNFIGGVGGK